MFKRNSQRHRLSRTSRLVKPELELTSLFDICTILLLFLLLSYESSLIPLRLGNEINVPTSIGKTKTLSGTTLVVSSGRIWVDGKMILDSANLPAHFMNEAGNNIIPLYNALRNKKEMMEANAQIDPKLHPFTGRINITADKTLKYSYLKKVLHSAALAGFREYKFMVKEN